MRFDDRFLEEVRAATDILEVIGPYVKLKRRGQNWFGLCPFHNEKTPSFSVNPGRGFYYCFGCGAGGDVVTFLIEHVGLEFAEAVEELANRAGIPIPRRTSDPEAGKRDRLREALEAAARFYQAQLKAGAGKDAVAYLKGRGIDGQTAKTFRLGYAPRGWEELARHLQEQGFPDEVLRQAGLVKRREGGGHYDVFRDRLVFPFLDRRGHVIGFGARLLSDEAEGPKYLNSPETPLYQKGQVLYGLPQAVETMLREERAVLVEGYFDVLSLHQAGMAGAVAASGTAFTDRQAQLLKRLVRRVVLVFDADAAGVKAAGRSFASLAREGLDISFVPMPAGEDPDTLVRSEGPEAFRARLQHAEGLVPFYLGRLDPPIEQLPIGARADAVRGLLELLAADADSLRREMNLELLAGRIGLDAGVLRRELDRLAAQQVPAPAGGPPRATPSPLGRLEAGILRMLLVDGAARERLMDELEPDDFRDPRARALFDAISRQGGSGGAPDTGQLMDRLDTGGRGLLAGLLAREEGDEEGTAEELLKAIAGRRVKERRRHLRDSIEQARRAGDEETLARLLKEYQEMRL
jgi:DNA primase